MGQKKIVTRNEVRDEFLFQFLDHYGLREAYLENVWRHPFDDDDDYYYLDYNHHKHAVRKHISFAFRWTATVEGRDFWWHIHKLWEGYCDTGSLPDAEIISNFTRI